MHTLFCVTGRTGSGKDTLVNIVKNKLNLTSVVSYTTRPKRQDESESAHIFISDQDFQTYSNDIVAYTEINHYKYFATHAQVRQADFYIIDPNGIHYLQKMCPDVRLIVINITVPEDIRRFRAIYLRHDSEYTYQKRCKSENLQFTEYEQKQEYNYQILNLDRDQAAKELEKIVLQFIDKEDT